MGADPGTITTQSRHDLQMHENEAEELLEDIDEDLIDENGLVDYE